MTENLVLSAENVWKQTYPIRSASVPLDNLVMQKTPYGTVYIGLNHAGFPEDRREGFILWTNQYGNSEIMFITEDSYIDNLWLAPNSELFFITRRSHSLRFGQRNDLTLYCSTLMPWKEKYVISMNQFVDENYFDCKAYSFTMDKSGNCFFVFKASIYHDYRTKTIDSFSVFCLSPEGEVVWVSAWSEQLLDDQSNVLRVLPDGRVAVWLKRGVLVLATDGTPVMQHYLKGNKHLSRKMRQQDESSFISAEGNELYLYSLDFNKRWQIALPGDILRDALIVYANDSFCVANAAQYCIVKRHDGSCTVRPTPGFSDHECIWLDDRYIAYAKINRDETDIYLWDYISEHGTRITVQYFVEDIIRSGDILYIMTANEKRIRSSKFTPDAYTYITAYRLWLQDPAKARS